jgi:hypothetical protein
MSWRAVQPKDPEDSIWRRNIAAMPGMTVDAAWEFFADEPQVYRSLSIAREVGLGHLRLGQPAAERSGDERSESSSLRNCSIPNTATRCMSWTSPRRAYILRTSSAASRSSMAELAVATP